MYVRLCNMQILVGFCKLTILGVADIVVVTRASGSVLLGAGEGEGSGKGGRGEGREGRGKGGRGDGWMKREGIERKR